MLVLSLILAVFTLYLGITFFSKQKGFLDLKAALGSDASIRQLNTKHILGMLLFGILFIILDSGLLRLFSVSWDALSPFNLVIVLVCVLLAITISYRSSKNDFQNFTLPQQTNTFLASSYVVLRIGFLLSYEFFFRGVLFFGTLEFTGVNESILINVFFYASIHMFHNKKELLGAIPFGILLCLITHYSNTILFAFIIHTALSLSYELPILFTHFKMQRP